MKSILAIVIAASALAGAAAAQPAWHPSEGGPPDQYPPCSHYGQDRCAQAWGDGGGYGYRGGYGEGYRHYDRGYGWRRRHHAYYGGHYIPHHHSSVDGERG